MVSMCLTKPKCNYHLHLSLNFLFQELSRQESKATIIICVLISQSKFANNMWNIKISQSLIILNTFSSICSMLHPRQTSSEVTQVARIKITNQHMRIAGSEQQWVNRAWIPNLTEELLLQRKEAFTLHKWSLKVTHFSSELLLIPSRSMDILHLK